MEPRQQATEPSVSERERGSLRRLRTDVFKEVYVNNTQVTLSPVDVVILFGHLKIIPEHGKVIEDVASITVSPEHYKAMVTILSTMLEAFERVYGKINIRDELARPSRNADEMVRLMQEDASNGGVTSSSEKPLRAKRSRGASQGSD